MSKITSTPVKAGTLVVCPFSISDRVANKKIKGSKYTKGRCSDDNADVYIPIVASPYAQKKAYSKVGKKIATECDHMVEVCMGVTGKPGGEHSD